MNSLFSATHTNETLSRWLEEEASSETFCTPADHLHSYRRAEAWSSRTSERVVVLQPLQAQMIVFLWMPQFHPGGKKRHGKSYWILMLLCFQPCCVWNNNRVWMRWLFVAKGPSLAVTAQQSVAAETLISHKQRLLSRSDAARPWASLSTCCGEYLFNNSFNHCTNSFPDATDRYF